MKTTSFITSVLTAFTLIGVSTAAMAYPLDGYEETGIRRVEGARLAHEGLAKGGKQPPGALLTTAEVDLRMLEHGDLTLPKADPDFTAQITALLGDNADRYGITVLDLTDPDNPHYAEHRGDYRQNVGSVGKMLGALGLFQALADTWPDDLEKRKEILHDSIITADNFAHHDHHTIRIFDVESRTLTRRPVQDGDQGSLWEYLDWMLSVSSNSAAAMVMRDAMLLRHFGKDYPVSEEQIKTFFSDTPRAELTKIFQATFWEPVTRNGLPLKQIRQGSFFTAQGKKNVNGGGNSYATAKTLMEFVLMMEQGKLVDEWTSRQFKRLLYMTEHRIRYASAPELKNAAVYFKSGSLYKCKKEEGFKCTAYHGNVMNYMNSMAIIEQEVDGVKLHYIVIVISNVLRENSAVDHQTMGTEIHKLIKQSHKGASASPASGTEATSAEPDAESAKVMTLGEAVGSEIAGTSWRLVKIMEMDDSVDVPDDPANYTLKFGADGAAAMLADCNRGTGSWTSESAGQLRFGPIASTKALCPPSSLSEKYLSQFQWVRSYVLKDGHLFLATMADGSIIEFEPISSVPLAATVLGEEIHTTDADEMQQAIITPLFRQYAVEEV